MGSVVQRVLSSGVTKDFEMWSSKGLQIFQESTLEYQRSSDLECQAAKGLSRSGVARVFRSSKRRLKISLFSEQ
ncbi:hypothetical protein M8J77_022669 [Diaphorina citri]|nr:hypothetical protein M8J77_022669 [Diaphorina citri]